MEIPQLEKGESFVVKPDLRFQISGKNKIPDLELGCCPASHRGRGQFSGYKCERAGLVCRTLNSLYRERRTMKNIALLSLLTLAILQPLAEAQRGKNLGHS